VLDERHRRGGADRGIFDVEARSIGNSETNCRTDNIAGRYSVAISYLHGPRPEPLFTWSVASDIRRFPEFELIDRFILLQ
jgi:hypothetical protein